MPRAQVKWNDEWGNATDGNGDKVGLWLIKDSKEGFAICKWCSSKSFAVKSGLTNVFSHAQAESHKRSSVDKRNNQTLKNMFARQSPNPSVKKDSESHKTAEIRWILRTISSNWSFNSQENIVEDFHKMFPDSHVPTRMQLGPTKMGYIVNDGIFPHVQKSIAREVSDSDAYALHVDEANKKDGFLGIVVRYIPNGSWSTNAVCIDLPAITSCDSKTIAEAICTSLEKLDIPSKNCLAVMSDSCRVMRGKFTCLFMLLIWDL